MKKDTIIRASLSEGNYATIRRECLLDARLTESGFRLLVLLLNNSNDWEIYLTKSRKDLGWSPDKMANAVKNLKKLGYLDVDTIATGKGITRNYTVDETRHNNKIQFEKTTSNKDEKLDFRNQNSETENQKLNTNKSNSNKITEKEELEKEEKNYNKCSVSVSSKELVKSEKEPNMEHDTTPKLKKEDFFFSYGELPTDEKVIAYVNGKKGYSKEVAQNIFQELHKAQFRNKNGERILGIQRYIDKKLEDYGAPGNESAKSISIEDFLLKSKNLHLFFVQEYIKRNPDRQMYLQTGLLDMKDAAKLYYNTISHSFDAYMHYVRDYIHDKNHGYTSGSRFKAYVKKHRERQIGDSGTDYFNRN